MKLLATTTAQAKEAADRLIGRGLDFTVTNCSGTEYGCWIEFDAPAWICDADELAYFVGDLTVEPST